MLKNVAMKTVAQTMPKVNRCPDMQEVWKALTLFVREGGTAELRIPNSRRGTVSGSSNNLTAAAASAAMWSGKVSAIYFTVNPISPALLARAKNHLQEYARSATSDIDITDRRWLPIDCGSRR